MGKSRWDKSGSKPVEAFTFDTSIKSEALEETLLMVVLMFAASIMMGRQALNGNVGGINMPASSRRD